MLSDDPDPLLSLLRRACTTDSDDDGFLEQAETFEGHTLWPALARHLARCSTITDQALLTDLARNPDQVTDDEQLCWGLKYWVRGDVMLNNGSVRTLDDVRACEGLDALPFLEALPQDEDLSDAERLSQNQTRLH